MEEWKDVKGFEGKYKVSNLGNLLSLSTGHILKPIIKKGYCRYVLHTGNNKETVYKFGHRLVAEAFILNYSDNLQVDHINNIRNDNRAENLRMVTNKENCNNPNSNIVKPIRIYFNNGDIKEFGKMQEAIEYLNISNRVLLWKVINKQRGSKKYNILKAEYI